MRERRMARPGLSLVAWVLGLAGAAAAQERVSCPASLNVHMVAPEVPGWTMLRPTGGGQALERIAVRLGGASGPAVAQSAYLREERGERKTIIASWDLAELRRGGGRAWLVCFYAGTGIELARELPAGVRGCEYRVDYVADSLREAGFCE